MVYLPDAIQGPDTREGNLVQKVCVVLHLRILEEDDIYSREESLYECLVTSPMIPKVVINLSTYLLLYP